MHTLSGNIVEFTPVWALIVIFVLIYLLLTLLIHMRTVLDIDVCGASKLLEIVNKVKTITYTGGR